MNHDLYECIDNFLTVSKYSRRKFAIKAGINPGTFQNTITRKSKIRSDMLLKVDLTMLEIINETKENNPLYVPSLEKIYSEFRAASDEKNKPLYFDLTNLREAIYASYERERKAIEEYNNMSPQMRETLERERKAIEEYNNMSPKMREYYERLQDAAKDCMPPQIQETFGSQHKKDSYPFAFFFFFDDLNEEGQQEALKRVEELTHIPKYQKKKD